MEFDGDNIGLSESLNVVHLREGDLIVLKVSRPTKADCLGKMTERIKSIIKSLGFKNIGVIALEEGMDINVFREETE